MNHFDKLQQFGLNIPIIQAPTGSIAGIELAAAVAAAGGMGGMGLTWTPTDKAVGMVEAVRAKTSKLFHVNYALAFAPDSLPMVLEAGAPCITFSWGNPTPFVERVRSHGALLGIQVTNREGARLAASLGADFLICQGTEAGGHVQATRPLREVLTEVLEVAENIPVFAAGGIANGKQMAEVLLQGALGVVMGTRFVATEESLAHPEYKRRIVEANSDATALTVCFDGGWAYAAHRVLRNSTLEKWEAEGCPPSGKRPGEGEIVGYSDSKAEIFRYEDTAPRKGFTGKIEQMCLYAGTSVEGIDDIYGAGEVVRGVWSEAQEILAGCGATE